MLAYARARFVRTSPRKARLVIDAIRGKHVQEALAILKFTPNYAARLIEKVLLSAAANAANNHHMDGDNLKVAEAMVDGGPIMKRLRYAPMGRGHRMAKRLSHITIAVEETEPRPDKKPKKQVAQTVKGPARKPRAAAPPAPEAAPAAARKPRTRAKVKPEPEAQPPVEVDVTDAAETATDESAEPRNAAETAAPEVEAAETETPESSEPEIAASESDSEEK